MRISSSIGIESFSIEGEELDKVEERVDEAFVARSRRIANEPDAPMTCYSFYSPWRDDPILTVAASSCMVRAIEKIDRGRLE